MNPGNKLGIGTVQFGLEYGINNSRGLVPFSEVVQILDTYLKMPSPVLDTSIAYGVSQQVIGKALRELGKREVNIVSKFAIGDMKDGSLKPCITKTMKQLNINKLYGFLAHNVDEVINNIFLLQALIELKEEGYVSKIGVSAYYPEQIKFFLDRDLNIDLIQIPYSLFDRRFFDMINICKRQNIEVHTRSCFVQGLMFKPLSFFKGYFDDFADGATKLHEISTQTSVPINLLLLGFACNNTSVDKVIIGIDSNSNLMDNLREVPDEAIELLNNNFNSFSLNNISKILPFNWPK